jgi:hypothetical protein
MITFRRIYDEDLEMIMTWRMMPEITKYMYTDPKLNIDQQRIWLKETVNNLKNYIRIINYNGSDIGLYSITDIEKKRNCFWAYYISDMSFQGKGIGTIVECNNYDFAFDVLGVHKVSCEVLSFNERVISIHQKFGVKIEGVFKDHILKDGKYLDIVRMAILKNEWSDIRNNFKYEISKFK